MMGDFKVHRVRFFEYTPLAVNCLAYDKTTQRLALSRSDGSIEIWSKPDNWFQEKVIAVSEERSVEGIVWMNSRLFSVGLDSNAVEYDLVSLCIKREASCSAGAIWCVAKNEKDKQLAVGTEDGCVVLFDAADDKLEYLRAFDKLEGRILCIAWHTGERVIVTGGVDNLRIWSVKSGHALQRILMGGKETMVWCVAVTSDLTIVSGDSRGKVSFWNGKQGTRITHFQSHKADVLTLCVDEAETSVFCAGVDPAVVQFSFLPPSANSGWRSWVRSSVRTYHTHDVRASVVAGNTVVTAGLDTNLLCSQVSGNKKRFLRLPALPAMSMVSVARQAGLVMLRYPTYLEVWRLGHTDATSSSSGDILPLKYEHLKLIQLKARSGERISCSAISADGSCLAFSDQEKLRVYRLTVTEIESLAPKVELARVSLPLSHNQHPAQRLAITPDNRWLVAATSASSLQIWDVSGDKGTLLHTVLPESSEEEEERGCTFTNLCVSDNSKMAATTDSQGGVHLYRLADGQVLCKLPIRAHQATAIAFTPAARTLLVTYSDHTVMEFDVHKEEYTAWSRGVRFPEQWYRQRGCLQGVMCQPATPSKLFLFSPHNLLFVNRSLPMPDSHYTLFRGQTDSEGDAPRPLVACSRYKFILHMELVAEDSVVVVERTPLSIQDTLPPALHTKKFGT
ncbi:LOW QUALITY PROTEIN: U3 small nucleolar RNA-associated protein 4 homolog [Babylonia areolata]|uniref:LOW QUALITY PROTEIN: U3 small nucleolar RNA-associated protein 4 homolog n=1 Tax=Babylonia areolata TaxID=304850 RepID=UPI003FD4D79D